MILNQILCFLLPIFITNFIANEPGYLDRYWKNGEDIILVAADDDVIAYLAVEVHREDVDYIYWDDLSVTEKKRGNGIGTSLMHKAEDYAMELGLEDILFHVEKTNTTALRLYERLGYKIFRDYGNTMETMIMFTANTMRWSTFSSIPG